MADCVLDNIIEKARFLAESDKSASRSDSWIAEYLVGPAIEQVISQANLSSDAPIFIDHTITLVSGQTHYLIPPSIGDVLGVFQYDEWKNLEKDWIPTSPRNLKGPGWRLEGNMLVVEPTIRDVGNEPDWVIRGIPTGDVQTHKGTGTVVGSDRTQIQLAAVPTTGVLDRRENAYVGQVIRIIDTEVPVQERVITSYNAATRTATVNRAFSDFPAASSSSDYETGAEVTYEVSVFGWQSLWDPIACHVAQQLGVPAGFSRVRMQNLDILFQRAMKTLLDRVATRNVRRGPGYDENTLDSQCGTINTWEHNF